MLTNKQEAILRSLDQLGFLKRSQLQRLHDLKSVRNANDYLRRMKEYMHVIRQQENIYYLNQKGRDYIGSTQERNKAMQINHILMRNDVYLHYGCPEDFTVEQRVVFPVREDIGGGILQKKEKTMTIDATFRYKGQLYFLEVDNTQHMKENRKKVENYTRMFPTLPPDSNPRLVFYTLSTFRQNQLSKWCKHLDSLVLTPNDLR